MNGLDAYFLISPTAMTYIPVLLLHLVSLLYLLLKDFKSRQTWLFCGWLGGMTLTVMAQFAARVVYAPRVSSYLDWWGGVGGVTLAMIALLQFAYHFPRLRYPREARVVLILSVVVTGAIWAWMAWETVVAWPHYTSVNSTPDIALASTSVWEVYDFERFIFGFVAPRDAGPWVSFKLFDLWQVIGNLWVLLIWARKTVQYSSPRQDFSPMRHALYALAHPQGCEARLSRAWVLLMLLAPLTVVVSAIDAAGRLPPGAFATVHLLVLFAITMTYVHYAPEPTSLMVKLVGISLVTLLIILGIVSSYGLQMRQRSFAQLHQAEVAHVQALVAMGDLTQLPADVRYVAARPVAGLFADEYRMLAARPGAADAAHLAAHDALLRAGLLREHFPARIAAYHESPWLGWDRAAALTGNAEAIQQTAIPKDTPSYRGAAHPDDYILRYSFVLAEEAEEAEKTEEDEAGATRYEVGYSYAAYRSALHRAALPLAALLIGATLFIVTVFPYFFHVGLVAPLAQLLEGVERVDRGELRGDIPVLMDDEIGRLTHSFNRMVKSLRASEGELRALNVTLEQRVVDRTRDLATLYEVAALVGQSLPLNELLAAVLARVVAGVDASAGLVLVTDEADGRLRPLAAHAIAPSLLVWVSSLPVLDAVRSQAETLLIHDLASDPRVAALFASAVESDAPFPYRSLVSLPIPDGESILGVLIIFGEQPFLFNVEDLEVLRSVSEQLSIAIENARLRERAATAVVWEERQRLARDLHDSVTQILYSQVLFANAARKFLDAQHIERVSYYLGRLGESATLALREMRLMIYRLRPSRLAEAGLIGALQRRLEMVEQRAGIRARLTHEAGPNLPDEIERALYHIAEEALNNALKHAAAAEVVVAVRYPPGQVCLSIWDDGCGFDVTCVSEGLGLQSLHERAAALVGELTVASTPGEGTRIDICFPLPPEE